MRKILLFIPLIAILIAGSLIYTAPSVISGGIPDPQTLNAEKIVKTNMNKNSNSGSPQIDPIDPILPMAINVTNGNLYIEVGSWEHIGIDSNKPATTGPNETQIQIHITNTGTTAMTNVWAYFNWFNGNSGNNITLAPGESLNKTVGTILPGQTVDVFWLTQCLRDKNAIDQYRNFTVTVGGDNIAQTSLNDYLEITSMISQNRNSIDNIYTPNSIINLGDTFQVYINASTSSKQYDQTYIPTVTYNASVLRPVNVTFTYTLSNGTTVTTRSTNIIPPDTNFYQIIWTFQAIGEGNAQISAFIEDETNINNHHYDMYAGTPPNITVRKFADIAVNKTLIPAACPGQAWPPVNNQIILTYINVTNKGPYDAHGVQITDKLPSTITYLDYSISIDGGLTWTISKYLTPNTYNPTTGVWNLGTFNYGDPAKILVIKGRVTATSGTLINNTANKTAQAEYDPNATNDISRANVTVA